MGYLDAHHPVGAEAGCRLCLHPRDAAPIERAVTAAPAVGPTVVAIGPERGWIEREVETFAARGFAIVTIAAPILRVEAAVSGALAQLALLRRL
jgi:RsmE family RNA methyltransferase